MAKEEFIERGERQGHGRSRDPMRVIGLSRQEALEIICYLSAALANESLSGVTGLNQWQILNISISDKGTILYRLILGLEERVFEKEAVSEKV